MNLIGTRIKELRKNRKLTQERLGRELGIDRSLLSRWESGRVEPTLDQLVVLGCFFHVPVSYFVDEEAQKRKTLQSVDRKELLQKMKDLF